MGFMYEELDFRPTPIGDLMLRRRRMPQFGDCDIYEVKLGENFLMTSLFHEAEAQLAQRGLAALDREPLDVVVGGLGLGYTAVEALKDRRIESLVVVDFLEAVIGWHQSGLVPLGQTLMDDARCRLVQADFLPCRAMFQKALILTTRRNCTMPFCWISITPPPMFSARPTPISTPRKDWANWHSISSPAAFLQCGPMACRKTILPGALTVYLPMPNHTSSRLKIPSPTDHPPARFM